MKEFLQYVKSMEEELGAGNKKPEILSKLAQYELTLLDWIEAHKGSRKYVAIAGKCWPAFQTQFGFVPCYVNSRPYELWEFLYHVRLIFMVLSASL